MNNKETQCVCSDYKGNFHKKVFQKEYYEGGAHFKASELFMRLIELDKEANLSNSPSDLSKIEDIQSNNNLKPIPKTRHRRISTLYKKRRNIDNLPLLKTKPKQSNNNTNDIMGRKQQQLTQILNTDANGNLRIDHHHHRNILSYYQNNPVIQYVLTETNKESLSFNHLTQLKKKNQSASHDIIINDKKNHSKSKQEELIAKATQTRNKIQVHNIHLQLNKFTIIRKKLPKIVKMPLMNRVINEN